MDYRAFVEENTQCIGDNATEVMLVDDVTHMLDLIESELDDIKTKLSKILDDLY